MSRMFGRRNDPGFTLLEILIYLAIVSVLIVAGLGSAYGILGVGGRGAAGIIVASEGNFLIRKIDGALAGAIAVSVPNPATLVVTKGGTTYTFSIVSGALQLTTGVNPPVNLNSANVSVIGTGGTAFVRIPPSAGKPCEVDVTLTVNSTDFKIIRYVRGGAMCT